MRGKRDAMPNWFMINFISTAEDTDQVARIIPRQDCPKQENMS